MAKQDLEKSHGSIVYYCHCVVLQTSKPETKKNHERFFETGEWCVFAAVLKFCAAQPHDGRSDPPSETLQLFGVCWAGGRRSPYSLEGRCWNR